MIPLFDARRQYQAIKNEIDEAARECLESGWYILGDKLKKFEEEFAHYFEVKHAVGVGNGADAIRLCLKALGVKIGASVVTAANTAIPTAMAIADAGCTPLFADIDERTWNIDPALISEAARDDTQAVVPVHLYGRPAPMREIMKVADDLGLHVVEDCAQAHGAKIGDRQVGTFGEASAFSFYPSKNLGACGDAGMTATNDENIAERLRVLRHYGQSSRYEAASLGVNSRLDELQAAILSVKLKHLDAWTKRRREIAGEYLDAFSSLPLQFPADDGLECAYHLFVTRCDARDRLMEHLRRHDVSTQVHYPIALPHQPAFKYLNYRKGDFPVAEALADEVLSLPLFPEMLDEEVAQVVKAVKSFF